MTAIDFAGTGRKAPYLRRGSWIQFLSLYPSPRCTKRTLIYAELRWATAENVGSQFLSLRQFSLVQLSPREIERGEMPIAAGFLAKSSALRHARSDGNPMRT